MLYLLTGGNDWWLQRYQWVFNQPQYLQKWPLHQHTGFVSMWMLWRLCHQQRWQAVYWSSWGLLFQETHRWYVLDHKWQFGQGTSTILWCIVFYIYSKADSIYLYIYLISGDFLDQEAPFERVVTTEMLPGLYHCKLFLTSPLLSLPFHFFLPYIVSLESQWHEILNTLYWSVELQKTIKNYVATGDQGWLLLFYGSGMGPYVWALPPTRYSWIWRNLHGSWIFCWWSWYWWM